MGSPVSPIIANLYMEHLEQKIMENCPMEIKPKLWKRYVDDILEVAKRDKLEDLTNYINTVDQTGSIKFTMDIEENNQLPMLDVLIHRTSEGILTTSVYRKKTHTDRYLSYHSHHPLNHKLGVIRSLLDRKDCVVSTEQDKLKEDQHIVKALMNNGYPKWTINLAKRQKQEKSKSAEPTTNKTKRDKQNTTATSRKSVVLPYINKLSEQLASVFKRYNVGTAMKPIKNIRSIIVHPKDKIEKENKTGVVYQIPCTNCEKTYIGETGRDLKTRMSEHMKDVNQHEKRQYTRAARRESETEINKSAITDHVNKYNHTINWQETKILAREQDRTKRWIREAIEIKRQGNTMNRDAGNYQLPTIYHSLITDGATVCGRASL